MRNPRREIYFGSGLVPAGEANEVARGDTQLGVRSSIILGRQLI